MGFTEEQVNDLLDVWPRLRWSPERPANWVIRGYIGFRLAPDGYPKIEDSFAVELQIPKHANSLPKVTEVGSRIGRSGNNHVYTDGSLCLGSPWRLRRHLGKPPSLVKFVDECVVPFLYAAAYREQGGNGFPFSELAHGRVGLIDDYKRLLTLHSDRQVIQALEALGQRPRLANKRPCPCGCGRRLGRCQYRFVLRTLRNDASRKFFRFTVTQVRS